MFLIVQLQAPLKHRLYINLRLSTSRTKAKIANCDSLFYCAVEYSTAASPRIVTETPVCQVIISTSLLKSVLKQYKE